jgi:hypothetical protein
MAGLMREHGDRFPVLTATIAAAMTHGPQDQALGFGLRRILDGIAAYTAQP